MKQLLFGFYGEGIRDYGFLMPLMKRVLERLLPHVDILDPVDLPISESDLSQIEKMHKVAQAADGFNLVLFGLDADAPNTDKAYKERFEPGYTALLEIDEGVNYDIVPIIPVRMTDAWIIIDFAAFRAVVGTKLDAQTLGFPNKPHEVESIQSPKTVFENAIETARPGRKNRPKINPADVYRPIAQRLDLNLLEKVPAYQEFEERLIAKLTELHFLDDK